MGQLKPAHAVVLNAPVVASEQPDKDRPYQLAECAADHETHESKEE